MTTEQGLPKSATARRHIERLRNRLDYLDRWIADFEASTGHEENGYRRAEAEAIRWAIPVLEAEWDNLVRLRAEYQLDPVKNGRREAVSTHS